MSKKILLVFLGMMPWLSFGHDLINEPACDAFLREHASPSASTKKIFYPNFSDNPKITRSMQEYMEPHLLPLTHPMKSVLDKIFTSSEIIKSNKTLRKAGFKILFSQKRSLIRVIKHKELDGYLIKLFPSSEKKLLSSGWKRLTIRCIVANKIKSIIRHHHIHNFLVADKWLYPLPPSKSSAKSQPVVLLVKDMQIYNRHDTSTRWRKHATKRMIKELYMILGRGYGSAFLSGNLPWTKMGKFAFIDTEYDKRRIPLEHARRFLSRSNQRYWDHLVKRNKLKSCAPTLFSQV